MVNKNQEVKVIKEFVEMLQERLEVGQKVIVDTTDILLSDFLVKDFSKTLMQQKIQLRRIIDNPDYQRYILDNYSFFINNNFHRITFKYLGSAEDKKRFDLLRAIKFRNACEKFGVEVINLNGIDRTRNTKFKNALNHTKIDIHYLMYLVSNDECKAKISKSVIIA